MAEQRTEDLLSGAVAYVLENGFAGLSLRPLAKELGTSDRMLLYHFTTKGELLRLVLARVADELGAAVDAGVGSAADPPSVIRRLWTTMTADGVVPYVRAYLELATLAFHEPETYGAPVRELTLSWNGFAATLLESAGVDASQAPAEAVSVLGTLNGAFLYWQATDDRAGADAAVEALANA